MYKKDTIAAVATPPGKGGVGIVRVSGPLANNIAKSITRRSLRARHAVFCDFYDADGSAVDQGLALFFAGPASFTGEDVLELQGHGGPVVMDLLLAEVLALGARIAAPGEFSERAFLNNKLDLAQAEAVADLIDSSTRAAARGAMRSLKGEFSQQVQTLATQILELRMFTEAAIDFPEEEIDFLSDDKVQNSIDTIKASLDKLSQQSRAGALLRDGLTLVFAGEPNAGKSSLMNRLVGEETSIVTEIPGTTRDVIREQVSLGGVPLKLVDTAGLRDTEDAIEQEGVRRARREFEQADGVLVLIDVSKEPDWQQALARLLANLHDVERILVVLNKTDLVSELPEIPEGLGYPVIPISAKTGSGLPQLEQALIAQFAPGLDVESSHVSRSRHLDALRRTDAHILQGQQVLETQAAGELFAEELKLAHQSLCEITGEFSSDDLLGEIFSSFCIGK